MRGVRARIVKNITGSTCVICGQSIATSNEAKPCDECGQPVHRLCAVRFDSSNTGLGCCGRCGSEKAIAIEPSAPVVHASAAVCVPSLTAGVVGGALIGALPGLTLCLLPGGQLSPWIMATSGAIVGSLSGAVLRFFDWGREEPDPTPQADAPRRRRRFRVAVIGALLFFGWLCWHFKRDSKTQPGLPPPPTQTPIPLAIVPR